MSAIAGGAKLLHLDVMDGHFVANLTIAPPVVTSLGKVARVPFDCHLMTEQPDEIIPAFAEDEVLLRVHDVLVMSVNPGFGAQSFIPSSLKKIEILS